MEGGRGAAGMGIRKMASGCNNEEEGDWRKGVQEKKRG